MNKTMTCLALGHNIIPVLFYRIVYMIFGMAFCTINLMLAAVSLDLIKDARMAAAAIGRSKGS